MGVTGGMGNPAVYQRLRDLPAIYVTMPTLEPMRKCA